MSKITAEHLGRSAIVYVRQSTSYQVANNLESQRRQYGLVERGRLLGWSDVQVIDDDLGRSGSGIARPGFEKLLAAICEGRVGAVLSIEASRLARNGRDWHTLLEFCGLVDTLIVDEDGIYNPRQPNDRLLLGMKGTMSEMELSTFRQRSSEAIKQKAQRGELFRAVAIGYLKTDDDRIEKDPDRRVQDAIALVFHKFGELQSVRQVLVWMSREKLLIPAVVYGLGKQSIEWKLPVYRALHHILTNPVYAGAYAFGRRRSMVKIENGRKRIIRRLRRNCKDWDVLITGHHEGYISWDEFERNQRLIADNANRRSNMGRGSIRGGEALLAGLLRCARCGRKLKVAYSGKGGPTQRYVCRGASDDTAASSCISFGGVRVDRAVEKEIAQHDAGPATALGVEDRERLLALGRDLSRAWDGAGASIETRKKIVRLVITEIIVDVVGDKLELVIHWHGGDHTRLSAKRGKAGQNQWVTSADVLDLVRVLARQMPDESIAAVLNRSGKSTGRGHSWTRNRVCSLRHDHNIAPYREGERAEHGEVTIDEAGAALAVSSSTILRMINDGILPAQHLCKGAPWIIRLDDLKREDVREEARARRTRRPPSGDPRQRSLDF